MYIEPIFFVLNSSTKQFAISANDFGVGTQFNLADVGPPCKPLSNQIYLVTFMCLTVDTRG